MVASFSFFTFKKLGMRYVQMPFLTRSLEPKFNLPVLKAVTRLQHQTSLLGELLAALPRYDRFELSLPPESELALPFVHNGFLNTNTYTFRDAGPHSDPWAEMEQKTRNVITSARKKFNIEFHVDLDRFLKMSQAYRAGASEKDRTHYEATSRIFEACSQRSQAMIATAKTDDGKDAAHAILIWDRKVLYYWLSVRAPDKSGNGANSLLIWAAFEFARRHNRIFDLDGYITPENGVFLSKFGFKPIPRVYVKNFNPLWEVMYNLRLMSTSRDVRLHYR